MIRMKPGPDGIDLPVFVCDWCGAEIEDYERGNAVWFNDTQPETPVLALFCHQGRCDELLQARNHQKGRSMALARFVEELALHSLNQELERRRNLADKELKPHDPYREIGMGHEIGGPK
jgi:hypothetical protein